MRNTLKENIPNLLTVFRMFLAIPTVICVIYSEHAWSSFLFLICALTDWCDGYLARKWNAESVFGKIVDPFVDKCLVIPILIALICNKQMSIISSVCSIIMIIRDVAMMLMRRFYASVKKIVVPAIKIAKIKTCLQMIGIFVILFVLSLNKLNNNLFNWWEFPLFMSCLFAILSFFLYIKDVFIKNKKTKEITVQLQEPKI